jgi:hypothetical protein
VGQDKEFLSKAFGDSPGIRLCSQPCNGGVLPRSAVLVLRFRHPKGGGATVHLERLDDSSIRINGSWYIDEYETFTRHFKWGPHHDLFLENIDLRKELEANLHEIVSWDKNLLTPHPNYKNIWSGYSKEEWDRIYSTDRLPLLRP